MASEEQLHSLGPPSSSGLAHLAYAMGVKGQRATTLRQLFGGAQAVTHAVEFASGEQIVLKRWPEPDPGQAIGEWARLCVAQEAGLPSPEPVAVDPDGRWFGKPALAMTWLSGEVVLHGGPGAWIERLVDAMVGVHDAVLPAVLPEALTAPCAAVSWKPLPPEQFPRTNRFRQLLVAAKRLQREHDEAEATNVLLHHDIRQNNLLWQDQELTGIVDWHDARVGPVESDVAYASLDVARTAGTKAASDLVEAYEARRGTLGALAKWQALWTASQLPWMHRWPEAVQLDDGSVLSREGTARRVDEFADYVLSRL